MPTPDIRPRRSLLLAYAAATAVLSLVASLAVPAGGVSVSLAAFRWMTLASVIAIGSLIHLTGVWTATGAYAAVFWCFHFGLVAALAAGMTTPTELSAWDQSWALSGFAGDAMLLALIGSLAFASGASFARVRRSLQPMQRRQAIGGDDAHPYGPAGSVLVLGAIASWCGIVISAGGMAGFFTSYSEYLQMTSDFSSAMTIVWLALGCGVVMSVTGRPGWHRSAAVAAFGGLAVVALPLGLRGEIMFPTVAALVARARCGRALSPVKAVAFGLVLLLLIPVVREVRVSGLAAVSDVTLVLPRLDALVEMGGSLHPVEKVVRWHAEGEPYEKGATYWAPFERAAARTLPGLQRAAAEDDMRIMNVLVVDRVGAIGFSPVAEAYRNFGPVGVAVALGLLGLALGTIDAVPDRRLAVLAIATIYVPLLTNVRNSFVSVPAQCLAGIAIVIGLGMIRHVVGSVLCRPYARAAYIRSEV